MNTDKELLEFAAKAAGMENMKWTGGSLVKKYDPSKPDHETGCIGPDWNPLTDDGDALRLAVKLKLSIHTPYENMGSLTRPYVQTQDFKSGIYSNEGDQIIDDPYAATRRAIVRAAAEIGKAIP